MISNLLNKNLQIKKKNNNQNDYCSFLNKAKKFRL